MSGPKIAAIYGLIPNRLGLCGPRQELLKKFIIGKLSIPEVIPALEKFEAAYPYYQLIAQKNRIANGPFNKKVVEAYWLGNELLEKIATDDLRQLIIERFSGPGLLSKAEALKRAKKIPDNSKPHHSFHVMVLGSITGSIDFTGKTKLKDICRIGWGRVLNLKSKNTRPASLDEAGEKIKTGKITINYNPLTGSKIIKFGAPIEKEIIWDKEILPSVKIGDWVSFHWNYALQVLNEENIVNLYKYTKNTLDSINNIIK